MYFNKVALIGVLGANAEARTAKNGASQTVLSLATKRSWKNGHDNYESRTYWHRAVAWGRLAAFAATLKKGGHVQLVGELPTREYEKEYGNKRKFTVKQGVCEIALESILKLDRAERQEEPAPEFDPTDDPAYSSRLAWRVSSSLPSLTLPQTTALTAYAPLPTFVSTSLASLRPPHALAGLLCCLTHVGKPVGALEV